MLRQVSSPWWFQGIGIWLSTGGADTSILNTHFQERPGCRTEGWGYRAWTTSMRFERNRDFQRLKSDCLNLQLMSERNSQNFAFLFWPELQNRYLRDNLVTTPFPTFIITPGIHTALTITNNSSSGSCSLAHGANLPIQSSPLRLCYNSCHPLRWSNIDTLFCKNVNKQRTRSAIALRREDLLWVLVLTDWVEIRLKKVGGVKRTAFSFGMELGPEDRSVDMNDAFTQCQ